jgi:hypothetical protein
MLPKAKAAAAIVATILWLFMSSFQFSLKVQLGLAGSTCL